jgi:cell division protease FtsH
VAVAEALLEYETLTGEEIHAVARGESIVRPEDDSAPPSGAKSSVPSAGKVGIDPNPKPQPES